MNYPGASCRGIEYKMQPTHKNTNNHPAASCEEFFRLKERMKLKLIPAAHELISNMRTFSQVGNAKLNYSNEEIVKSCFENEK